MILAQPLTIYLGTADTVQDKYFDKGAAAMKQGESRYERGKKCFALAQELAKKNGWKFGWRLVEAPMIGHDAKAMFDHLNCDEALGLGSRDAQRKRSGARSAWGQDPARSAALALRVAATRMQF